MPGLVFFCFTQREAKMQKNYVAFSWSKGKQEENGVFSGASLSLPLLYSSSCLTSRTFYANGLFPQHSRSLDPQNDSVIFFFHHSDLFFLSALNDSGISDSRSAC